MLRKVFTLLGLALPVAVAALLLTGEGLEICRRAARSEFFTPDVLLNLARVQILTGLRGQAWRTLTEALRLDPSHREIRAAVIGMGVRRRPLIPFFERSNPLNRAAGKIAARLVCRTGSRRG